MCLGGNIVSTIPTYNMVESSDALEVGREWRRQERGDPLGIQDPNFVSENGIQSFGIQVRNVHIIKWYSTCLQKHFRSILQWQCCISIAT